MLRLASTVMLVRPTPSDFEVFMVRRSGESHFVPNAYVFPGGTVDEADMSERTFARSVGIDAPSLQAQFRAEQSPGFPAPIGSPASREAAGLLIAAVRELFEEAGVLLACDEAGTAVSQRVFERDPKAFARARARVAAKRVTLAEFLERSDLYANTAALALFSHWITPPVMPRRYNAHFFVALASADQAAAADRWETHDGLWVAPQRALELHQDGSLAMVYPTIKHLERLVQFDSAEAVMHFARTKTIYSIMPGATEDLAFSLPSELERAW